MNKPKKNKKIIKTITNEISNPEINIFWNFHNTIFNMPAIDEIIQCPCVYVHLQTNTAVSGNTNASPRLRVYTH
jgi:hypothetical protein